MDGEKDIQIEKMEIWMDKRKKYIQFDKRIDRMRERNIEKCEDGQI